MTTVPAAPRLSVLSAIEPSCTWLGCRLPRRASSTPSSSTALLCSHMGVRLFLKHRACRAITLPVPSARTSSLAHTLPGPHLHRGSAQACWLLRGTLEHPVRMEKHCITSYPIPTRPHPGSLVSTVLPIPTLSIICLSISHLSLSTYGSHLSICPLPAYLCQSPGYLVSCLLTFYLFTCQSSFYHLSIYYLATITFLPTYLRKAESTG